MPDNTSACDPDGFNHGLVAGKDILNTTGRGVLTRYGDASVAWIDSGAFQSRNHGPGQTIKDSIQGTPVYMAPESGTGQPATQAGEWYA